MFKAGASTRRSEWIPPSAEPNIPRIQPQLSPAEQLEAIRTRTCYTTLRGVIEIAFLLLKVLTGLAALGLALASFFIYAIVQAILIALGIILAGTLLIILLHALHQAALLLVDVADAAIHLVIATRNLPVSKAMDSPTPVLPDQS